MSPNEADEENGEDIILARNLRKYIKDDREKNKKNMNPSKFKRGQFVKIFKKKGLFTKGYQRTTTKEYFKIYHIDRNLSKDRYYLKDLKGEKILGSFYEEYLVLFNPDNDAKFKIDPRFNNFKRKMIKGKEHVWVKWLGWPDKFNQWVPMDDVRHLVS